MAAHSPGGGSDEVTSTVGWPFPDPLSTNTYILEMVGTTGVAANRGDPGDQVGVSASGTLSMPVPCPGFVGFAIRNNASITWGDNPSDDIVTGG
jgi:hypothetical protein